ncbi:DNA/RNA nuclease SfsA [Aliidiomarina taiwanensis]|uniref:Sugar fermentation stimulation protein homolog n=1 Tax=Aliidiomarina taiwanensis TaxID=946228 RepID=A0A432X1D1_9GAMM|nr:DNA/RNA nuclease SfsA [Aliidiomarina taiwanensis]RUO40045.1 DNA/RNA nuclease SfsA [Aliidiomarina taiwanensis]
MQFEPSLSSATLIRRYKRFLADVTLPCGETVTIHCPNTGAMTGCAEPGSTVWFSTSDNPKRKYSRTWELTHTQQDHWICVNTHRANKLVEQAILQHSPAAFEGYTDVQREVRYGEKSRIDLVLKAANKPNCYVEVKSVTLLGEEQQGYFPDATSDRAARQLEELTSLCQSSSELRAFVVYAVLHSGVTKVNAAKHIDPKYTIALENAKSAGLQVLEAHFTVNAEAITFSHWRT